MEKVKNPYKLACMDFFIKVICGCGEYRIRTGHLYAASVAL